jgi:hypothetical protein
VNPRAPLWLLIAAAWMAGAACRSEHDALGNPIDGKHRVDALAVLTPQAQVLWKISAPSLPGLEHLDYGKVPDGFAQEVPAAGVNPRSFVTGEKLIVVIVTPEYVYRGDCEASGPSLPRCESWESARPKRSIIERAMRGERIAGS